MSESAGENEGWKQRAVAEYSKLQITVERHVEHDQVGHRAYDGPSVFLSSYLRRLAALAPGGSAVVEVPFEAAIAIYDLACATRDDRTQHAIDTGDIRLITTLTLTMFPASGRDDVFTVCVRLNHTSPSPWSAPMSALLCRLRDELGPRTDAVADALDDVMTWIKSEPLDRLWDVGGVVRLPHVVTAFANDDRVYLRVGQVSPSGPPSSLYQLNDKVLTCVDTRTHVPPRATRGLADDLGSLGVTRWELPCGGAVITRRGPPYWRESLVVRCNDPRGIYVQRAIR